MEMFWEAKKNFWNAWNLTSYLLSENCSLSENLAIKIEQNASLEKECLVLKKLTLD